ncbi:Predicted arabinose efflux permease, MFS family [Paramicrobacterium humi]|uniref:Predicted arabinose efflux permease, MFS family n=1 Tax=Paramicrobacterium humi TaxID=640635 RepID=A0A1H4T7Y5_9MICO|nr:MFS transporter [Microbacterium humi]SEC52231.1 Predicted arabinose efflux permease, MFS family [Microbacterium humi]
MIPPRDPGPPPDRWHGHEHGSPEYRRLIAALFFAGVATFAQLYSPQALLPLIARDLHVTESTSAVLISAATLGLAIGVIPWSLVADRVGRVRAMTIAVIAATVLGILVPFAPGIELMLGLRLLEGLMLGGVPALAIAYLSEELAPAHTARAAGTYIAGTTIGGLSGRLVAGAFADIAGWRVGILAVAALCAAAAALFVVLAPPPRGFRPGRRTGVLRRVRGAVASPRLWALYAQGFLLMGGFVAMYNFLGFRLERAPFALSTGAVSLMFLAYLAGTWSSARVGALAERWGRLRVLAGGILVMVCGVLVTLSDQLVVVLAGLVIMTAGFFAAHAIASGWTGQLATTGRAQASSLYNLMYYSGSSLFGWLGGIFLAGFGWPGTAVMIVTLALVGLVIAGAALRRV